MFHEQLRDSRKRYKGFQPSHNSISHCVLPKENDSETRLTNVEVLLAQNVNMFVVMLAQHVNMFVVMLAQHVNMFVVMFAICS